MRIFEIIIVICIALVYISCNQKQKTSTRDKYISEMKTTFTQVSEKNESYREIATVTKDDINTEIKFNIENIGKPSKVNLSEIGFNEIVYIPLETNEHCLISKIRKIKTGNSYFLVKFFGEILKFNMDGSFVAKIGAEGRGPQEFQNAQGFSIESKTNNVYVLSAFEDKIYVYSTTGEFVKTIPAPTYATNLACLDDLILCYCDNLEGSIENSFEIIDYNGNSIKSFPNKYKYERGKFKSGFGDECFFYMQNDELYSKEILSDTIYIFENLDFKSVIVLARGKKRLPPESRIINHQEEARKKLKPYIYELNLFGFGDIIYSNFVYNNQIYSMVAKINGNSKNIYITDDKFINDIDGGPNVYLETKADENTIISWIYPVDLKAYVATEAFKNSTPLYPEKKKALEKLANSLNENDNPVLMLVKLKE